MLNVIRRIIVYLVKKGEFFLDMGYWNLLKSIRLLGLFIDNIYILFLGILIIII